jgi:hypothetical protein
MKCESAVWGRADGLRTGRFWRRAPKKGGAFLHRRLVEVGQRGVAVRSLGAAEPVKYA